MQKKKLKEEQISSTNVLTDYSKTFKNEEEPFEEVEQAEEEEEIHGVEELVEPDLEVVESEKSGS